MSRSLQTGSSHLYKEVARHTQMAPHLQSLAQACIDRMEAGGADRSYIGIHLRIEDDFERLGRTGGKPSDDPFVVNVLLARTECMYLVAKSTGVGIGVGIVRGVQRMLSVLQCLTGTCLLLLCPLPLAAVTILYRLSGFCTKAAFVPNGCPSKVLYRV